MRKFAIRKSDGTVWEPSYADDYGEAEAMRDAFLGSKPTWYFRGGRFVRKGLWIFSRLVWERDGSVWRPEEGREFSVVSEGRAKEDR